MIHILVCDPNYAPAVSAIRTPFIIKIRGWQKRGANVSILCSTEALLFYKKSLKDVTFYTFPFLWRGKSSLTVPWEYIKANFLAIPLVFKVKGKFDIVYSISSTLDIIFFPWVLTFLDHKARWFAVMDNLVPHPKDRPGNYLLKVISYQAFLLANFLLKRTDSIFVVTSSLKKYYEGRGIKVIKTSDGNGLDIASFSGKIDPNTPKFTALFAARLHPAKGIFDLIEITKEVVKQNNKFSLGMMGYGDEKTKKKLYDLVKKYKLSKNIYLLGHKNTKERWDLYRNSDFFLFPSYAEGCPQVVLEAFAANKLVIAYDLPEYKDPFKKYIKAKELILFRKGNFVEISNYIYSLRNKKIKFHNKLKDFSWEKIIDKELIAFQRTLT